MSPVKPLSDNPPRKAGGNTDFVLAHLSDPHLSSLAGISARDLAGKRILGYLSWWRRRRHIHRPEVLEALVADLAAVAPDHTVVTGDFTHLGLPGEFAEASRWLSALGTPQEVSAVLGNHDAYVATPWSVTGRRLQAYLESDPEFGTPEGLFPSLRLRGPLALVGLSTACPSGPFTATGRLGTRQLEALARLLLSEPCRGRLRVVLLHHPPAPGSVSWRRRLVDAPQLADVLRETGAELVLHGHAHHTLVRELEVPGGRVPVLGVPSASDAGDSRREGSCYHLYRFSVCGGAPCLRLEVRRYAGGSGDFQADGREGRLFTLPGTRQAFGGGSGDPAQDQDGQDEHQGRRQQDEQGG